MRIGKVIGRLTLQPVHEALVGGRFLLVEVQDRFSLAGQPRKSTRSRWWSMTIWAAKGDLIAFTESREAAMPFYPEKIRAAGCARTRRSWIRVGIKLLEYVRLPVTLH